MDESAVKKETFWVALRRWGCAEDSGVDLFDATHSNAIILG